MLAIGIASPILAWMAISKLGLVGCSGIYLSEIVTSSYFFQGREFGLVIFCLFTYFINSFGDVFCFAAAVICIHYYACSPTGGNYLTNRN